MMPQMTKQSQSGDKHTQCTVRGGKERREGREKQKKTNKLTNVKQLPRLGPKAKKTWVLCSKFVNMGQKNKATKKEKHI